MSLIKCQQPGCSGTVEDGFCSSCGLEGAGGSPSPAQTGTIARGTALSLASYRANRTSSTDTRGSSRMGTKGSRSSGRSSSRQVMGLGLVRIPELPFLDPATVIMANPVVPENKRYCPHCEQKLTREKGFCPKCGKSYCFTPTLAPGDVVASQYEVLGAMAFGGLGWIYLAKDNTLSRWVVLKGLLNAKDASSADVAVAERQFLAAVKHPNIVGVYNFVEREAEGYIVMEFVRGRTLKDIRKERGPIPVTEAIAYIHRILSAFSYLHRQDPPLIYCDFKPDNVMLEGDDLKLIDLGAVRGEDDSGGEVYGTKGYSAPEGGVQPSVSSDLYTVGRSLAVLIMDFKGFQSRFQFSLPGPDEQPLLSRHESLHRFLLKATQQNPLQRFGSANEMAEQLAGILREIVASEGGTTRPTDSSFFGADPLFVTDSRPTGVELIKSLPSPKLDSSDSAAQFILTNSAASDSTGILKQAVTRFPDSSEAPFRLAYAQMLQGHFKEARVALNTVRKLDQFDWRSNWYCGLAWLAGNTNMSIQLFDELYSEFPGELAPKLALALALECQEKYASAARFYQIVCKTDPSYLSALFGLARCYREMGEVDAAVQAYGQVPASSHLHSRAQIALARTRLMSSEVDQIAMAAGTLEALGLEGHELHRLSAEVFHRAVFLLENTSQTVQNQTSIFGKRVDRNTLREGLEENLRGLARLAKDEKERNYFVDLANDVRPQTWL